MVEKYPLKVNNENAKRNNTRLFAKWGIQEWNKINAKTIWRSNLQWNLFSSIINLRLLRFAIYIWSDEHNCDVKFDAPIQTHWDTIGKNSHVYTGNDLKPKEKVWFQIVADTAPLKI